MVVTSESPSYVILLATGPEPGISLQDEDLLSPAVQRQPLLVSEPALGPLLEAPCPPYYLTPTMNKQTYHHWLFHVEQTIAICAVHSLLFGSLIFQFAE